MMMSQIIAIILIIVLMLLPEHPSRDWVIASAAILAEIGWLFSKRD